MIAGGSGMAPVLCAAAPARAAEGCERPVCFFYGARSERDLFALEEIAALGERLTDFRFDPVVGGFVHEAVDAYLGAARRDGTDVYMCGPPPMLEAAEAMLAERGSTPGRIFMTSSRPRPTRRAGGRGARRAARRPPERRVRLVQPQPGAAPRL